MESERQRSNWWYLLPLFFGFIGGIIAYFCLKNDDIVKAKTCICIPIVCLGFVGGIISYFILRKHNPSRAKLFLYIGIALTIIATISQLSYGVTDYFDQGFNVNI